MPVTETFVQVAPDSTGKKIDNIQVTSTTGETVLRQVTVIADPETNAARASVVLPNYSNPSSSYYAVAVHESGVSLDRLLHGSPSLYVEAKDRLRLKAWNSASTGDLQIRTNLRFMRVGSTSIVTATYDLTISTDRIVNASSNPFGVAGGASSGGTPILAVEDGLELGAGYLLNIQLNPFSTGTGDTVLRRGTTFCELEINRGSTGEFIKHGIPLIADYLTNNYHLGWPAGVLHQQVEGRGHLRSILGTDPSSSGAEVVETVPTNARWNLLSFKAPLVTSASTVTRTVAFVIDDGANIIYDVYSNTNQTANLTYVYQAQRVSLSSTAALGPNTNRLYFPLPATGIPMFQGWRIRTATLNIDSSDNWGVPIYTVEEWIED